MAEIIDLFQSIDFDTQSSMLVNEANATREYAKQLKSAFNHLSPEGQRIIAMLAETLSKNPDYHEDYEDENGNSFSPPDEIWLD